MEKLLNIDSLLDKNILKEDELQRIADKIMKGYCIDNGQYQYRPIEIEFYIYDKIDHPDRHVYPRDDKYAGELFFHYSGMDICLKSSFEDGRFGGILIRALERVKKNNDEKNLYFGGPLVCVNEVLNTANTKCEFKPITLLDKNDVNDAVSFGRRVGINEFEKLKDSDNKSIKDEFYDKPYRFVRRDMQNKTLERENVSYDFKNQTKPDIDKSKRKYKIERYKP